MNWQISVYQIARAPAGSGGDDTLWSGGEPLFLTCSS